MFHPELSSPDGDNHRDISHLSILKRHSSVLKTELKLKKSSFDFLWEELPSLNIQTTFFEIVFYVNVLFVFLFTAPGFFARPPPIGFASL